MRNAEFLHHWAALKSFTLKLHCHWNLKSYFPFIMAMQHVTHVPFQIKSTLGSVVSFLCNEMCRTKGSSLFCCPAAILNSFLYKAK